MKRVPLPGSRAVRGALHAAGAAPASVTWQLAEEVPVGILLNSDPVAVMMATSADLEELGVGFVIAEGHARAAAITAALVLPTEDGFAVDVAAPGAAKVSRARGLEGRTGCGLCGLEALTDLDLDLPHRVRPVPEAAAVLAGFAALTRHQPIRDVNRSVHAAGFADAGGAIVMAREDVGRHCALDKLVGALAVQGIDPATGVAVLSSRGSFELVRKAALAGLGGLATLSAPTALAVTLARRAGLPLFCVAPGGVVAF